MRSDDFIEERGPQAGQGETSPEGEDSPRERTTSALPSAASTHLSGGGEWPIGEPEGNGGCYVSPGTRFQVGRWQSRFPRIMSPGRTAGQMAEARGFEPRKGANPNRISSAAP